MRTTSHPSNSLNYPKPEKTSIKPEETELELYRWGNEIQPYSLDALDIDDVDRVVAVDSKEGIAEDVRKVSSEENVLNIFGENPQAVEEALGEICDTERDEIKYILTDSTHSEYVIESYSNGKREKTSVTDEYSQAKRITEANILGVDKETLNTIEEAKNSLENLYKRLDEYKTEYDSIDDIPGEETPRLSETVNELENKIEEAQDLLGNERNPSPRLRDEVRAISAEKEMSMPKIKQLLDTKQTKNVEEGVV